MYKMWFLWYLRSMVMTTTTITRYKKNPVLKTFGLSHTNGSHLASQAEFQMQGREKKLIKEFAGVRLRDKI